jgi:hypothetical protein
MTDKDRAWEIAKRIIVQNVDYPRSILTRVSLGEDALAVVDEDLARGIRSAIVTACREYGESIERERDEARAELWRQQKANEFLVQSEEGARGLFVAAEERKAEAEAFVRVVQNECDELRAKLARVAQRSGGST